MKKLDTKKFIEKANAIHGDFYDYSVTHYINAKTKVEIICPKHGSFLQATHSHLSGVGCRKCSTERNCEKRKDTKEQFIKKANKLHDNKYDYSKAIYISSKEKVEIICPTHGSFFQTPSSHLQGAGCKKCANILMRDLKQKDTEWFIRKAREIHGNLYDYSKSNYTNALKKIEIICPKHGSFMQVASGHLNGKGCSKCHFEKLGEEKRNDTQYFIRKAKEIHGDTYEYTLVDYITSDKRVKIICLAHGVFSQKASAHLSGAGCRKCGVEQSAKAKFKTQNGFIAELRKVHNDRYDYSKVVYTSIEEKIEIVCREHGSFMQVASSHLRGKNCPECSKKSRARKRNSNTEEFIAKAINIHGSLYDYSKVNYKKASIKVEIICPIHKSFMQSPNAHLSGNGCAECGKQKKKRQPLIWTDRKFKSFGIALKLSPKIKRTP